MKNIPQKNPAATIESVTAEAAAAERLAAELRAEAEALQAAETARRQHLGDLLQDRSTIVEIITRNTQSLADHASDAQIFETMADNFFATDSGGGNRAYNFLGGDWPHHMAARAVEMLTVRLDRAKAQLAHLDSKILSEAREKNLGEMLPQELLARIA